MIRTGCDFSTVFKEYEQEFKKTETLKEEASQETVIQEPVAMVEYKQSFMKRMVSSVKKIYNSINEKMSGRDSKTQESELQDIDVPKPKKEKLPSWDLRNWTQEELQSARIAARKNAQTKIQSRTVEDIERDD